MNIPTQFTPNSYFSAETKYLAIGKKFKIITHKKKNKAENNTIPDFHIYYKTLASK